jgi:hypothetical protein
MPAEPANVRLRRSDLVEELRDLGVFMPEKCRHWNERKERFCTQTAVDDSDFCVYHGGNQQVQALEVAEHRKQLLAVGVPIAVVRLIDVLNDPHEKSENVIRAAFGILDRVGLGPIAGLVVHADETVTAPLEALTAALNAVASRRELVVEDAVVVEDGLG